MASACRQEEMVLLLSRMPSFDHISTGDWWVVLSVYGAFIVIMVGIFAYTYVTIAKRVADVSEQKQQRRTPLEEKKAQ